MAGSDCVLGGSLGGGFVGQGLSANDKLALTPFVGRPQPNASEASSNLNSESPQELVATQTTMWTSLVQASLRLETWLRLKICKWGGTDCKRHVNRRNVAARCLVSRSFCLPERLTVIGM